MDDWGLRRPWARTRAALTLTLTPIVAALLVLVAVGIPASARASAATPASIGTVAAKALRLAGAHRRDLTAAVLSFDGRTRLSRDGSRLEPLGSTMKILILDEAAHEIASGRLRASTRIPLPAIDATYIPGTDGNAHALALTAERKRGWIRSNSLSLRHVLDAMIEFSDNAATDTVMRLIDDAALARRAARLGQDMPLSPDGLFVSWGTGVPAVAHAVRGAAYNATVERLARRLATDGAFRYLVYAGLIAGHHPTAAQQAQLTAALAPRGSASGYARLVRSILTGRDAADRLAASVLGWPLRTVPKLGSLFTTFAQKGGELPGVLTVVEGIVPRGRPGYVTVLLFHGISANAGDTLTKADVFDLVPIGLTIDATFRRQAAATLGLR